MPGSLLVRDYRGQQVVVKVLEDGFEYADRRYSSLTAIAQEVTGTKWNGFLFFGLTGKEAADAKRYASSRAHLLSRMENHNHTRVSPTGAMDSLTIRARTVR